MANRKLYLKSTLPPVFNVTDPVHEVIDCSRRWRCEALLICRPLVFFSRQMDGLERRQKFDNWAGYPVKMRCIP